MKIIASLLAAAVLSSAPAYAQRTPAQHGPMQMDVAGVRLSMPLEHAKAALSSSYRCDTSTGEATFAQQVQDEVNKRRSGSSGRWGGGRGTARDECIGANGERLTIRYVEGPGGAIVDRLSLALPHDRFERAEMKRALLAKFGRPSIADSDYSYWCDADYRCDSASEYVEGPQFRLDDVMNAVRVEATRGGRAHEADLAAVQAAADRIAPRKSTAVF